MPEVSGSPVPDTAQERYASWLERGTRLGFVLLVAGFLAYMFGVVPAHVPVDRLPALWTGPASTYLELSGMRTGWGWVDYAHRGDVMNLVGIAVLAGCSLPSLAAVAMHFHSRRDRIYAAICVLEIAVIALAASGVLAVGH